MIIVDTETTGVDSTKHAIISVGALELENPENDFYGECRIWDGAHIMDEALEVNGFSKDNITDESKQSQKVLLTAFVKWAKKVKEQTLAGHNVQFDINFLEQSLRRVGESYPFCHRSIDTHSLTYMHMIKRGLEPPIDKEHQHTALNSDFVFDYVGVDINREVHNALEDAKLTAEAVSRLLYDEKLLKEFSNNPIPWEV